jgi:hypothetical protein
MEDDITGTNVPDEQTAAKKRVLAIAGIASSLVGAVLAFLLQWLVPDLPDWLPAFLLLEGQVTGLVLGILARPDPRAKMAIALSVILLIFTALSTR